MIGNTTDFARRLRHWYDQNRRDLPWRVPKETGGGAARLSVGSLDPYKVIVSEAMLQQTQVATVIPYFNRFIAQFPDFQTLASADPQSVLRAWQGLGYYSRARNLQATAKKVIADFSGQLPQTVDDLLTLPGIGRYTAGAVSSIAFGKRSPILDGNVARVLCRLDAVRTDPRAPATRDDLWLRAEEILPRKNIGDFNSALMELGALICTPRSPQCLLCPVRTHCEANAAGLQEKIPVPKPARKTPLLERWTFRIRHGEKYLVQQRSPTGRWAGMWQFATMEPDGEKPSSDLIQSRWDVRTSEPVLLGTVEHALTHRRYRFHVFACNSTESSTGDWATLEELNQRPMPKPHLKIRGMGWVSIEKTSGLEGKS
jgi:A/G-specific adenine glycosylase